MTNLRQEQPHGAHGYEMKINAVRQRTLERDMKRRGEYHPILTKVNWMPQGYCLTWTTSRDFAAPWQTVIYGAMQPKGLRLITRGETKAV